MILKEVSGRFFSNTSIPKRHNYAFNLNLYSFSSNPRSSVRAAENAGRMKTFKTFSTNGFAETPVILNGLSNS